MIGGGGITLGRVSARSPWRSGWLSPSGNSTVARQKSRRLGSPWLSQLALHAARLGKRAFAPGYWLELAGSGSIW